MLFCAAVTTTVFDLNSNNKVQADNSCAFQVS